MPAENLDIMAIGDTVGKVGGARFTRSSPRPRLVRGEMKDKTDSNHTGSGSGAMPGCVSHKMFLRRRSDGKFYRGARLWRWCRSWRYAAVLQEKFWRGFVTPNIRDQYDLVTLDEIET